MSPPLVSASAATFVCRRAGGHGGNLIAAGGFDDDRVRPDSAGAFFRLDHGDADAVFHTRARRVKLKFGGDSCAAIFYEAVETHQRRVAHEVDGCAAMCAIRKKNS